MSVLELASSNIALPITTIWSTKLYNRLLIIIFQMRKICNPGDGDGVVIADERIEMRQY